jgi:hypothetical protein
MDAFRFAIESDEDLGLVPVHDAVGEEIALKVLHVALADALAGKNPGGEVLKGRKNHLLTPPRLDRCRCLLLL